MFLHIENTRIGESCSECDRLSVVSVDVGPGAEPYCAGHALLVAAYQITRCDEPREVPDA